MAGNQNTKTGAKSGAAAKTVKVTKGSTLVARVSLKGDFEMDDGLGTRAVEVRSGDEFMVGDEALAQRLVDQGYAKVKGAKDDGTEPAAVAPTTGDKK